MPIDLIALRHELHQHPEIAFQEHSTKSILLKYLHAIKDEYSEHTGTVQDRFQIIEMNNSTGILVKYAFGDESYRLFRADMDALPIEEQTAYEFSSTTRGMMHACGHDIHMTVLMGLIESVCKDRLERNLLFLFQPAEEGQGGAECVLAEGIIQEFDIDSAIALHVGSEIPVNTVASRAGIFFGIPQEFDVRFTGIPAHVAFPEKGVNAIGAALDFMSAMDKDIFELSKKHKVIFHVGKISGGSVRNVIADRCVLEGTHRSLHKDARDAMNDLIHTNSDLAARAIGASSKVDLLCSYDPVVNNASLVEELSAKCRDIGVQYQETPVVMTGEDFGFFTSLYPGVLFWLGSGCDYPLHSDHFLPDEACIATGVKVLLAIAKR